MSLIDLIVDEGNLDENLLEKIITPYIRFAKDNGRVRLTPSAVNLTIGEKIILYLLGKKAAKKLGMWPYITENSLPIDIENDLGIPGGSLRPNLMNLYSKSFLEKDQEGKYYVPNHVLPDIEKHLASEEVDVPF